MIMPTPTPPERAGCGYALLSVAAFALACWHSISPGNTWITMWMVISSFLAAHCSVAEQTIARQRVRLADPRRTPRSGGR